MALFFAEVAMTGTAIPLSTIFPKVSHANFVRVQTLNTNADPLYVGGSTLTLTTNRGATTGPIGSVQQPIMLHSLGLGPTNSVYVVGTAAEVALITVGN